MHYYAIAECNIFKFFKGAGVKLWDKGGATDSVMHQITVGDDPVYDLGLLRWDCIGSLAQAKVLHKAGLLTDQETNSLIDALVMLHGEAQKGEITISTELEDAHTTIENLLVERVGDAGKKIHTGRSRNDQVITALRLFLRDLTLEWCTNLLQLTETFAHRYKTLSTVPMPGFTHMQPAMPSSLGMWLHAFIEGSIELVRDGLHLYKSVNRNPLGASAGFGSSLPIDREYSASLMGFDGAQRSFIDIQNSRGRYEEKLLFWASQVGALYEKFAWDVELYCTREYGFFSLPDELTTGSSIMPQKKNPDIVELLRARCSMMRGYLSQLQWVIGKLPSNYHRDLQLSKAPLFQAIKEMSHLFNSVDLVVRGFQINTSALDAAMGDELFATYAAYRKVKDGTSFRDAYKITAEEVKKGAITKTGYEAEFSAVVQETDKYFEKSISEHAALKHTVIDIQRFETEQFAKLFARV